MSEHEDRRQAVLGHASSILLPVLGPAIILLLSRRSRFVCAHALIAVTASAAWVAMAVLIISIDSGRFSVDESRASTSALVGLVVAFLIGVTVGVVNIQRAKSGRGPMGWPNVCQG